MLGLIACSLLLAPPVLAAPPAPAEVTARLDAALEAKWKKLNLTPEAPADDATFLRRVYLDLAGRVPPALKAREFLDDRDPAKRARLVAQLLDSEDFADHWGRTWAQELTGRRPVKQDAYDGQVLAAYLKASLAANKPYTRLVTELICAEGLNEDSGPVNFLLRYDAKPTDLAGAVSKQFLGLTLQCAQCHNHPFAGWKKADFWGTAAYFGRIRRLESQGDDGTYVAVLETRRGELTVPDMSAKPDEQGNYPTKKVAPRLPGGAAAPTAAGRRQALAAWVTADDNPYFARHLVNRVWGQLFGAPLVKNLEQEAEDGDGTHVQVLGLLADDFVAGGHDVKRLVRVIVLSRAYQLSVGGGEAPAAPADAKVAEARLRKARNLARFPARPLSVDQLYQSVVQATGYRGPEPPADAPKKEDDDDAGDPAVDQLGGERAHTVQRSLALLNGDFVAKATQAGARSAVAVNGRRAAPAQVEWLFLTTLARRPSAEESAAMLELLKGGDRAHGLEDVLWVLLNSAEFNTNH
jgi:hypothetical protein